MTTKIIQVQILEKSIESLKYETREKTGSKALLKAARSYQAHLDLVESKNDEIRELRYQLERYESLIKQLSKPALHIQSLIEDADL